MDRDRNDIIVNPGASSAAREAFAAWVPSAKERNDMIEVAAYHIAERTGFKSDPHDCWAAGEAQVDLMLSLRESQTKLQTIVDSALDAMVMIDSEGIVTAWNPRASRIFGWSQDEALGQSIHTMIIPLRYRTAHVQGMAHYLASGEGPFLKTLIEVWALHRDGHEFPIELTIAPVMTARKLEFSAFIRDITERKRLEAELLEMATTDFLTGLFNRRHFMSRIENELARIKRSETQSAAVLMLDLDHFKHVNDSFGHAIGDEVLRHFAHLIRDELRKIDTAGRVGGEEFAILLTGADATTARVFAERLRVKVAETPVRLEGGMVQVTVSVGIAVMTVADESADAALLRADEALYRAKARGRNRVQ